MMFFSIAALVPSRADRGGVLLAAGLHPGPDGLELDRDGVRVHLGLDPPLHAGRRGRLLPHHAQLHHTLHQEH